MKQHARLPSYQALGVTRLPSSLGEVLANSPRAPAYETSGGAAERFGVKLLGDSSPQWCMWTGLLKFSV